MTWHLEGLKVIPQVVAQLHSLSRSCCSTVASSCVLIPGVLIGRYTRQSSANRRTCETMLLGRSLMYSLNCKVCKSNNHRHLKSQLSDCMKWGRGSGGGLIQSLK